MKVINVDEEGKHYRGQAKASVCSEKGGPSVELQTSISASTNVAASEPSSASGIAENEVAEAVEIATEQPSTSFVKPMDRTPPDVSFRCSHLTSNLDSMRIIQMRACVLYV